ncbi:MAG: beta-galactosidase [Acidobacteria bacterium]|nr:beta-galactosidase [Acidobacteriota bacterium]MBP8273047.1 beta-galactosidase [Acidobacteriota bacterium]
MKRLVAVTVACVLALSTVSAQSQRHTFSLGANDFLLDGKPLQIIACEMHPARIPVEYWQHRIQMAKAMGCNTVAAYIFWNYHETDEGKFDFTTTNHDLAKFFDLVKAEGMWALLRPGPYVCAEWDFGGIPSYLLKDPELRVRSMYPRYMKAAERYMAALAVELKSSLVTRGGSILMVQVENEYGSYANDRTYMSRLRDVWKQNGVDVPFFTGDGPTPYMLEAGSLPGAAVGLDSGSDEKHWTLARSINPGVPVFSSETYPGWLTHWGEKWQRPGIPALVKEVTWLLDNKKSFNFYVAHGGTNFGFTAGANSGGKGYEPDVTSYDYDAPIDEQGRATPKFMALRELIGKYLPAGATLPAIPAPIPVMAIPEFAMTPIASLRDQLPAPVKSVHPRPFEYYGQNQGLALYRTTLVGRKSGKLIITDLHDFATIYVDGKLIGTLDRRLGEKSIDLPAATSAMPVLDILVEGMGHINFAQEIIDRKGITDRVTLSGMTLMNWDVFLMPLTDASIGSFKGTFTLETTADTYIDMTGYKKGVVWVNGHNLGRYWDIGPQTKLYCPASWLKKGRNDIVVLDLLKTDASPLRGSDTPDR